MGNTSLEKIRKEVQDNLQKKLHEIPHTLVFPEEMLEITKNSNALKIQSDIFSSKIQLSEIFKHYHHLKQKNNNEHNLFTDIFYAAPLERAEELDKLIKEKKITKETHPLIGFIFSIKDSNKLKNSTCTNGFLININKPLKKNPETIKLLISKGALITCKGNVPQALFSPESNNNVFGKSLNPYNKERTTGGSSGGDSGLVSIGVVNSSIGSDVGGSLRIPALFCGITAFKPTTGRISKDMMGTYFDQHDFAKSLAPRLGVIQATIGPICKTVDECEEIMKVLCETSEFDKDIPPLKWDKNIELKRVGVVKEIKKLPVSVAHKRAMRMAEEALKQKGIEIVEFDINDLFDELVITSFACFMKNKQLVQMLSGKINIKEGLTPAFDKFKKLVKVPKFLLKQIEKLKDKQRVNYYIKGRILCLEENENFLKRRVNALYYQIQKKIKNLKIDVLLSPGCITPAIKLESSKNNNLQFFYTFLFNLLNMPGGVLPITKVQEGEEIYEDGIEDEFTKSFRDQIEGSRGLPVGVHLSALCWKDESIFVAMKIIKDYVQFFKS